MCSHAPTTRARLRGAGSGKLLAADGLDDGTIDAGLDRWTERLHRPLPRAPRCCRPSRWKLVPGVVETLETLGREHRLALLTGNPERMARARMDRLGIARCFTEGEGAFGSDGERRAELIGIARERAGGWPAERTVLVGDTPRDVAGAHEAGVRAIGVTTGRFGAERACGRRRCRLFPSRGQGGTTQDRPLTEREHAQSAA